MPIILPFYSWKKLPAASAFHTTPTLTPKYPAKPKAPRHLPPRRPAEPVSLSSFDACQKRETRLQDRHIAPLTAFVRQLRSAKGPDFLIPYCDPLDGGTTAKILFLLEAPTPKAVRSGFVSRDNPDAASKTFFDFNRRAKIPREQTLLWNIVPWYIGYGSSVRPANAQDFADGLASLEILLKLLPLLRAIVLVGRKAQKAELHIQALRPTVTHFLCPHPSPKFINRVPAHAKNFHKVLGELSSVLNI